MNLINLIKQLYIEYKASNAIPYIACHPELGVPIGIFNTKDEPTRAARIRSIKRMGPYGNLNSYGIALSLGIYNPIPSFVAGSDFIYPLVAKGIYHFNCDGTKIDFLGGASQILPYSFHDDVNFACEKIDMATDTEIGNLPNYKIEFGANNAIRFYSSGYDAARLTDAKELHVDADVIAFSSTTSDIRLKENIQPIIGSLEAICNLNGVKFDWKYRDEKNQIGLIAQNVEEFIPEAIKEHKLPFYSNDEKEYKTINYDMIVPHMIESIKTLKLEIDNLKLKLENK